MMKKVYLDTNVILDFLLKREGFAREAAILINLGEKKRLQICLSPLSINNIDYVISKIDSRKKAREVILQLLSIIKILPVTESTIKKAALSEFKDFKDAVQNFCAEEGGLNHFITRNLKDFKKSKLSIQTPKEFLASAELDEE